MDTHSHVVTGAGRGVGRAVAERLLATGDSVVVVDLDPAALEWTAAHPAGLRAIALAGDAADEALVERAAGVATAAAPLAGWVNNAAVFRDAALHTASARAVLDLIALNLDATVAGARRRSGASWRPAPAARSSTSPLTRPAARCPAACRTRPPRRQSRA